MIAAQNEIEIGDHTMFANGCFVGDAEHRYDDPDDPGHPAGLHLQGAGPDRLQLLVRRQLRRHQRGDDRRSLRDRRQLGRHRGPPLGVIAAGAPARVIREIEWRGEGVGVAWPG